MKKEALLTVGKALYTIPPNFTPHPNILRDLKKKQQMFETGKDVDWATAEALAFGTLLLEGNHVRLSGQVQFIFFFSFFSHVFKKRMWSVEHLVIATLFFLTK